MNDKIKDHIIQIIINDKEISGKEKASILKELFDAQPCLRQHFPEQPIYIPYSPCPDINPFPITYTGTSTTIDCNSGGGVLLPTSDEFVFNIHPNN